MAIYTDSGGPNQWKASAIASGNTVQNGLNEYAINDPPANNPVVLTPADYWIVAIVQANTVLAQGAVTSVRYKTVTPWNSPFPMQETGMTSDTLAAPNFYLVGVP